MTSETGALPSHRAGEDLPKRVALYVTAMLAMGASMLWNDHHAPSAAVLTQCLGVMLWGTFVLAVRPAGMPEGSRPLLWAVGLLIVADLASGAFGTLPASLTRTYAGALLAAGLLVWTGDAAASGPGARSCHRAFFAALLFAGLGTAVIGILQALAPAWVDGWYISESRVPGRAVGNIHQPNLAASVLVWGVIGAAALLEDEALPTWFVSAAMIAMGFAIELTGSRTGLLNLLVLAAWALADRRLARRTRLWLGAATIAYFAGFAALALMSHGIHAGAGGRMADEAAAQASANDRWHIWTSTAALVRRHPLLGAGFGEFSPAWTLTPTVDRPSAHFDNAHNLPLHLAAELGVPLATVIVALLAIALWRAFRASWLLDGQHGTSARCMFMAVLVIMIHSMLEYPLWYAWFLMPTAFAWGFAISGASRGRRDSGPAVGQRAWLFGAVMAVAGAAASLDYLRVTRIYNRVPTAEMAARQIATGQRSFFFAHYADYVAATAKGVVLPTRKLGMHRAVHCLLDLRLMMAWADELAAEGHLDEAKFVARRLAEFHRPEPEVNAYFAPCRAPGASAYQCQTPSADHDWRELVRMP